MSWTNLHLWLKCREENCSYLWGYCGSNFSVHAISVGLREELADSNVRVTTIAPGAVETDLLSHTTSEEIKLNYQKWKAVIGGVQNADDAARPVMLAYLQPQNV